MDRSEEPKISGKPEKATAIVHLPIDEIQPSPLQPRQRFDKESIEELADSLKKQGMLQPIVVRKIEGAYQIVIGERRLRAARRAGTKTVLAIVKDDVEDMEAFTLALVENIQREDMNPIETAAAYKELMSQGGLTQEEVATRIGKKRGTVSNTLRLLTLPPELQAAVGDGSLTPGHAKVLLRIADLEQQIVLSKAVISEELSVRELEKITRRSLGCARDAQRSMDIPALQHTLMGALAAEVKVKYRGKRGLIEIHFQSFEDLERIANLLVKLPQDAKGS